MIATGALIETGFNYKIQVTFPFIFRNPKRGDNKRSMREPTISNRSTISPLRGAIEVIVIPIIFARELHHGARRTPDVPDYRPERGKRRLIPSLFPFRALLSKSGRRARSFVVDFSIFHLSG